MISKFFKTLKGRSKVTYRNRQALDTGCSSQPPNLSRIHRNSTNLVTLEESMRVVEWWRGGFGNTCLPHPDIRRSSPTNCPYTHPAWRGWPSPLPCLNRGIWCQYLVQRNNSNKTDNRYTTRYMPWIISLVTKLLRRKARLVFQRESTRTGMLPTEAWVM